tara:strand:- start:175 stop:432 length:258 start_codon:yes stop_codon:yes gene_type:complete
MKRFNDKDAFLLFGEQINKILKCLYILEKNNKHNEGLSKFIDSIENLPSYDDMLDSFLQDEKDSDHLESILDKLGLRLPGDDDKK